MQYTFLDEINTLIIESEMVSTNGKTDKDVFVKKYTISKSHLLRSLSYSLYTDDCLVGFFMIACHDNQHELEYFYIRADRLGKGYGKLLWDYVNDICVEHHIRNIYIVCGKNITAFYRKMGAEKVGEVDSELVNPEVKIDRLFYQCKAQDKNESFTQEDVE